MLGNGSPKLWREINSKEVFLPIFIILSLLGSNTNQSKNRANLALAAATGFVQDVSSQPMTAQRGRMSEHRISFGG
jgi:hypothetical protein